MKLCFFRRTLCTLLCLALAAAGYGVLPVLAQPENTAPTSLPCMFITLSDGVEQSSITKEEYLPGSYSLVGAAGFDDITDQPLEIKGRGNYSWSKEKKPYNIKLESKTDLLGMGKSKKWCLIANYLDKTLLRNYTTMELARRMGMTETTDCRFIDLYVNGAYYGNFLLTERVEAASNRVDIDTDAGSQLFEIEMAYRHTDLGCDYCHETAAGVHVTYKDPEYTDFDSTDDFFAKKNTVDSIIDAAEQSMTQGYAAYSQTLDVDSFVNWYILNEYVKNYDSAFVTSCYFYYDAADGKLHMGPVWDYDTCYGNQDQGFDDCLYPEGFHVWEAPWFSLLLRDGDFLARVQNRWNELQKQGLFGSGITEIMNAASEQIAASRALDEARWPDAMALSELRGDRSLYTYAEEFAYLKDWSAKRTRWLDTQWQVSDFSLTRCCNVTNQVDLTALTGNEGVNRHALADLFDGDTSTKYCTNNDADGRLTFGWKMTRSVRLTTYAFATANDDMNQVRTPVSWIVSGSQDGESWTAVDTKTNQAVPQARFAYTQYLCDAPESYLYYRITVTGYPAGNEGMFQLSEVMLGEGRPEAIAAADTAVAQMKALETVTDADERAIVAAEECWAALTEGEKVYLAQVGVDAQPIAAARRELDDYLAYLAALDDGDVDDDGSVTAADALLALQISVRLIQPDAQQLDRADVDGSGRVDAVDALLILRYSVGTLSAFPVSR